MKSRIFYITIFAALLFMSCQNSKDTHKPENKSKDQTNEKNSRSNDSKLKSEITCPKCSFKTNVTMPTDVCLLTYTCTKCDYVMRAQKGDCCVFCSYGTHECPSMQ